jgi:hypothetical protein
MKLVLVLGLVALVCSAGLRTPHLEVKGGETGNALKELIDKVRSISRQAAQDNVEELKADSRFPDVDETVMKFMELEEIEFGEVAKN